MYSKQSIHVTGGPLNTFLPVRDVLAQPPSPQCPVLPPYLDHPLQVQSRQRPTSLLSELLIKQDSISMP